MQFSVITHITEVLFSISLQCCLFSGSSSDGGRVSMVKVEKSGFATVMMKCEEKSSEVLFRDGTTISATAHGSYRVRRGGVGGGMEESMNMWTVEQMEDGWMRLNGWMD